MLECWHLTRVHSLYYQLIVEIHRRHYNEVYCMGSGLEKACKIVQGKKICVFEEHCGTELIMVRLHL